MGKLVAELMSEPEPKSEPTFIVSYVPTCCSEWHILRNINITTSI